MRKIYYIKCKKYKKIIKPKISYICCKTLLLSSICNNCKSADEKIFMEQESIEIIQIIGFINNIEKYQNIKSCLKKAYAKNLDTKIDEIRNYLIEEIYRN